VCSKFQVFFGHLPGFLFSFVLPNNGADKATLCANLVHTKNEFLKAYKLRFKSHKKD
jgi:hypothetical protein